MAVMGKLLEDFVQNVPTAARGNRESDIEFFKAPLRSDATVPYLRETLNFDYGSTEKISLETLVVFGTKDQVILPEHGLLLTKKIEHARSFEHGGGHYIPLQNHAWMNEKLMYFFAETENSRHEKNAGTAMDNSSDLQTVVGDDLRSSLIS